MTTARHHTPSGRPIHAKGIEPDILVEEELPDNLKAAGSVVYVPTENVRDTLLNYALNYLRGTAVEHEKLVAPAPPPKNVR